MRRRAVLLGIALAAAGAYVARHETRRRAVGPPRPAEPVAAVTDGAGP